MNWPSKVGPRGMWKKFVFSEYTTITNGSSAIYDYNWNANNMWDPDNTSGSAFDKQPRTYDQIMGVLFRKYIVYASKCRVQWVNNNDNNINPFRMFLYPRAATQNAYTNDDLHRYGELPYVKQRLVNAGDKNSNIGSISYYMTTRKMIPSQPGPLGDLFSAIYNSPVQPPDETRWYWQFHLDGDTFGNALLAESSLHVKITYWAWLFDYVVPSYSTLDTGPGTD